jgi:hypothetical protein
MNFASHPNLGIATQGRHRYSISTVTVSSLAQPGSERYGIPEEFHHFMQLGRFLLSSALVLATAVPALASTHARRGPTSHTARRRTTAASHTAHPAAAPRVMDSERATEIQTALIKAGYLTGTPSGHWDAPSEAAMQKLQGDNGWQTKLTPDSRALIKLGLGPKQDVAETGSLPSVSTSPAAVPQMPPSPPATVQP